MTYPITPLPSIHDHPNANPSLNPIGSGRLQAWAQSLTGAIVSQVVSALTFGLVKPTTVQNGLTNLQNWWATHLDDLRHRPHTLIDDGSQIAIDSSGGTSGGLLNKIWQAVFGGSPSGKTVSDAYTALNTVTGSAANANNNALAAAIAAGTASDLANGILVSGANILINGDFESGLFAQGVATYSGTQTHSGVQSLKIVSNGSSTRSYFFQSDNSTLRYVPVSGGDIFYAEVWVCGDAGNTQATGGANGIRFLFEPYSGNTALTASNTALTLTASTALNSTWTKLSGYVIMPSNANRMKISVQLNSAVSNSEAYYFDDALVREVTLAYGANTKADSALNYVAQNADLSAEILTSGSNIVKNSSFEKGFFLQGVGTFSTEQAHTGSKSLKIMATGSTKKYYLNCDDANLFNYIPVTDSDVFYVEMWVWGNTFNAQTSGGTGGLRITFEPINASGAGLSDSYIGYLASNALNGAWTKISGYVMMPTGATKTRVNIQVTSAVSAAEIYFFDDIIIREVTLANTANTTANTANANANTANASVQTTTDNIHQSINGGTGTGNALATIKSNLQLAWAKIFDGHNGTTGNTSKLPADVYTAAAAVRSTATTASSNASTAITNAGNAQTSANTANTNIQTTTDNIHQSINGGSSTGNALATIKSNLQLAWANIWDGHNGTTGTTSKLPSDVLTAAAGVRSTATTAATNASTAITNAGNAQTSANTANTNIQTTTDNIHQAINGGAATGNALATIKSNLQLAWANIWDGHNGTTGTTSKLPSDVLTAAAGVRSTATTAATNASTAITNAGNAQTAANTANTNIQTNTDNIHQAINGGAATGNALATVKSNLQLAWAKIWDGHNGTTGTTSKLPSDIQTVAATVASNASTALTTAGTASSNANTANTNIQTTTDNIHQAINGGSSTGNALATIKSNLQLAWANIWDGHNGTSGSTSKLPSDILTVAASVRSTANNANTTANTASTNVAATNTAIYNAYFGSGGTGTSADATATLADIKVKLANGWTLQTITTSGTWTKPWSTSVPNDFWAICIGGGTGGTGGTMTHIAGGVNPGGAGGAGGGYIAQQINPPDITSTVAVTIGAGGAGGAGVSSGSGTAGTAGTATTFGAFATSVSSFTAGAIGSLFGYYDATTSAPGKGGNGRTSDGSVVEQAGGSTPLAAGGTPTTFVGNDGAAASLTGQTHAGGGGGAGGRATGQTTPYRTGGNGGFPGGGGGGGGGLTGSLTGSNLSGAGGAGANGVLILLWK